MITAAGRARPATVVPAWFLLPGLGALLASVVAYVQYRRYVPALEPEHLGQVTFGTRAQLVSRDGRMLDDFAMVEAPGRLLVLNAPSPAATASLAIGEMIAGRVRGRLGGRARG